MLESTVREGSTLGRPIVTVLMSVFNGERYLVQAVASMLAQTFGDYQFVIVDDGSTDSTADVLSSFAKQDARVIVIRNDTKVGLAASLNRGLQLATGAYIARMDADDCCHPERLARQLQYLEAHPEVGLLGSCYNIIGSQGEFVSTVLLPLTDEAIKRELPNWNCFAHGAALFRRECVARVGAYRSAFQKAQDYDLWLRIAEAYSVANLPEVLYSWRFLPDETTVPKIVSLSRYTLLAQACARERRLKRHDSLGPSHHARPVLSHIRTQRYISDTCTYWASKLLELNSRARCLELVLAALQYNSLNWRAWLILARHYVSWPQPVHRLGDN